MWFLSNQSKRPVFFSSKSWKFWKKRCFDVLQTVRFHFFKKNENHHLGLPARAKSRNNPGKAWFWWTLDTVISLFEKKNVFVEIVARHCVLRFKNHKFWCFWVFFTSRIDFQRPGRIFKLMQNRTHHKTTPNSTSERPSGLTVSVTLEDAWPKQTWGCRPEVANEQGWQALPTRGSAVYWLQLAPTWFRTGLKG